MSIWTLELIGVFFKVDMHCIPIKLMESKNLVTFKNAARCHIPDLENTSHP